MVLIRVIEAFKLVDLPNIMTAGGPGIATELMTLHAFFAWRAPDLAQAAAVSYLLLFLTVVMCVSFFNLVVLRRRASAGMSAHDRSAPTQRPTGLARLFESPRIGEMSPGGKVVTYALLASGRRWCCFRCTGWWSRR